MNSRQQFRRFFAPGAQNGNLPLITLLLQTSVARPSIHMDGTSRFDTVADKGMEGRRRGILDGPHPASPNTGSVHLRCDDNQGLPPAFSTICAFINSSVNGLVHLDPAAEPVTIGSDHRPSQLV